MQTELTTTNHVASCVECTNSMANKIMEQRKVLWYHLRYMLD